MATLPCLTLTQPWASLMAIGAKKVETRGWAPRLTTLRPGDRIAIHAAKGWTDDDRELMGFEPFKSALRKGWREGYFWYLNEPNSLLLPRGAVVGIGVYTKVLRTDHAEIDRLSRQERAFGNYSDGRYAWFIDAVKPIEPIPARGQLGVWRWDVPDWMTYLELKPPTAEQIAAGQQRRAAAETAMLSQLVLEQFGDDEDLYHDDEDDKER